MKTYSIWKKERDSKKILIDLDKCLAIKYFDNMHEINIKIIYSDNPKHFGLIKENIKLR